MTKRFSTVEWSEWDERDRRKSRQGSGERVGDERINEQDREWSTNADLRKPWKLLRN